MESCVSPPFLLLLSSSSPSCTFLFWYFKLTENFKYRTKRSHSSPRCQLFAFMSFVSVLQREHFPTGTLPTKPIPCWVVGHYSRSSQREWEQERAFGNKEGVEEMLWRKRELLRRKGIERAKSSRSDSLLRQDLEAGPWTGLLYWIQVDMKSGGKGLNLVISCNDLDRFLLIPELWF